MTEDDIATATGLPLHTWRRRHAAAFRARVPVVNPGERLRLYDEEQARAFINGKHWPTGTTTEAADATQWPTAASGSGTPLRPSHRQGDRQRPRRRGLNGP
ncbi:hypothetical protein ACIRSF_32880, partial [Streptomyces rubiginosohelvolus]